MKIRSYDFGENIVNGIDVSEKQINYSTKYSKEARENQFNLLKKLGVENYFLNRVDIGCVHGTNIAVLRSFLFTEDRNKISDYDGVITDVENMPLFLSSGDCLILMVVGKKTIGLLHCSRKTIDEGIVMEFFSKMKEFENLSDLSLGISPYIFQENFSHEYLNLIRDWKKFVLEKKGKFYLDLKGMVEQDLFSLGIKERQIYDFSINTYDMSKKSLEEKGFQVSHKHYLENPCFEGRLGICLMKKSS